MIYPSVLFLTLFTYSRYSRCTAKIIRDNELANNNAVKPSAEIENRIVGGANAAFGEFPFVASWYFKHSPIPSCGGSLVAPNLVLTAAHCKDVTGFIRVGCNDASGNGCQHQANVIEKIAHPRYLNVYFDYMLLELDRDINTISPINLNFDSNEPRIGDMLTVIGFGTTSEGGSPSGSLQKVNVPANSYETCRSQYGTYIYDEIHLCAGYPEGGKDACQGDSGGPIFEQINGVTTQVGVVSHGSGCARKNQSGVYARLSGVSDWLKQEICDRAHGTKPFYCDSAATSSPRFTTPSPSPAPTKRRTPAPTRVHIPAPTRAPTPSPATLSHVPLSTSSTISSTIPPTLVPNAIPYQEAPNGCVVCTDNQASWMQNQDIQCTSSTSILFDNCSKNEYWTRNKICQFSCYNEGFGYPGDECCVPSNSPIIITSVPVSSLVQIPTGSLNTSSFPALDNLPASCTICTDVPISWLDVCEGSSYLSKKCDKNEHWIVNKYCQHSCYSAGYGYLDDVCCGSGTIPTAQAQTISPSTSTSPSISPLPSISVSPSIPPSLSPLPSVSPSISLLPSISVLPSIPPSLSPSIPPSLSPLPSIPPSLSPLPSVSPSLSPTTMSPMVTCNQCDDLQNPWMKSVGITCAISDLIPRKCNKNTVWREKEYCQYSCYKAGLGYSSDVCCDHE